MIDISPMVQQKTHYDIEYSRLTPEESVWTVKSTGEFFALAGFGITLTRSVYSSLANVFFPSFLTVITSFIRLFKHSVATSLP